MKKYVCLLLVCLCAGLMACSNDDNVAEDTGIAIESIQANACEDLSNRADWILLVNYQQYNCTKERSSLTATVKDKTSHFNACYEKGSKAPYGGGPVIRLTDPGYYAKKKTRDTAPTPPDIADQTTPEKLLKADVLSAYYSGIVSENLTGVELTHANALLEFEVTGAPANTVVLVRSYMSITPFNAGGDNYKAIVLAEGGEFDACIVLSIGGEFPSASLRETMKASGLTKSFAITGAGYIQRDTHYKFTVVFDPVKKTLLIKDIQKSQWSKSDTWMPE